MMRRAVAILSAASLACRAYGESVNLNEANWDKEVSQRVSNGQFVFVKFQAPWCGHCKKLKPDWDKLGDKFNHKTNAIIGDVDCTVDNAKKLCETYGVEGFPTLKYFAPGLASDGEKYEDAREYSALSKFVKKKSKKPCDPSTLENCDKKDKAFIEEIKELDEAKLLEEREKLEKELNELTAEHKEMADLFEKQKEEALATMKRSEDLKGKLSKLQNKLGYKLLILKAKTAPAKSEL